MYLAFHLSYIFLQLYISKDGFLELQLNYNLKMGEPLSFIRKLTSPVFRTETPAFKATQGLELPWEEEAIFTKVLMHVPNQKPQFHKVDIFHTVSLGVGKTFVASGLVVILPHCGGASVDSKLAELTSFYLEFCKAPQKANMACIHAVARLLFNYHRPIWFKLCRMEMGSSGAPENELRQQDNTRFTGVGQWCQRGIRRLEQRSFDHESLPVPGVLLQTAITSEQLGREGAFDCFPDECCIHVCIFCIPESFLLNGMGFVLSGFFLVLRWSLCFHLVCVYSTGIEISRVN